MVRLEVTDIDRQLSSQALKQRSPKPPSCLPFDFLIWFGLLLYTVMKVINLLWLSFFH